MEETRQQRIARLTEEFRKLLEEKFPEKGSTMQRIEELTEEIGCEIEQRIEEDAEMSSVLRQPLPLITEQFWCLAQGRWRVYPDGLW